MIFEMQRGPQGLLTLDDEKLKIVNGNSLYLKDGLLLFTVWVAFSGSVRH